MARVGHAGVMARPVRVPPAAGAATGDAVSNGRDPGPVRVVVVDDQPTFVAVARAVVAMTPGFEVVAVAGSGEEAVESVAAARAAMVLMDINLPGISGIEATRRIVAAAPDVAVVLMSTYQAADLPAEARTCGARAYVHKEDLDPDVLREVRDGIRPFGM